MTLSGFVAYIKQLWANKPSTSSPLSAERLNHMEDGIKANSDGITKIVTSVTDQVVNDTNKIASAASLYSVKQDVVKVNSDLVWKLAFSVQGVGNCDLPSEYRELLIIANAGTAYNSFIYVPHTFLTDQWQNFSTSDYVTQADNSFVGFKATKSLISLVVAYTNNGTDSSALCSYSVYYR